MSAGSASDAALDALFVPFATGELTLPVDGALILRARDGFALRERRRPGWLMQQSFKPAADALQRSGFDVVADVPGACYPLVMVLPTRQREETQALFAQAIAHRAPGGVVLASVANAEGAKTAEADFARLAGRIGMLSKHKCRVFWSANEADVDHALLDRWNALDAPVSVDGGRYTSRRGLFAWDRVDTASALLASVLPGDLSGRLADLGAGFGYLACEAIARCPGVVAVDLYEAEARALGPARRNLDEVVARAGREVTSAVHWHDVTQGVVRAFDVVLSNPPFHQGRPGEPDLGRAFITAAAGALRAGGRFWMVANRHLAYEGTLDACFGAVRTVVERDGFKVIEAREPRP
ncbi:class I SAM-dependent methyltransferase [Luteibacter sahnii]|uniref:class I SAM-dependent methyltransferase n=1 Tax=Luteibacter sahnii TaxID=3021977 RepID=UPI002A6A47D6|nr:methyltransferase [Luteibacter sp. PPL193]MDY1549213.1 methyltransferase [Luteibacter sp. PPL193]